MGFAGTLSLITKMLPIVAAYLLTQGFGPTSIPILVIGSAMAVLVYLQGKAVGKDVDDKVKDKVEEVLHQRVR